MTETTPPEPPLSDDQQAALDEIDKRNHRFYRITGGAGRGKSHLIARLRKDYGAVITATTGRAAINVSGYTVDRLFSLRRRDWTYDLGKASENLRDCNDMIVIDEASMIGANMARVIETLADRFDKTIVLVGDWGQAMPVKDEWPMESALIQEAKTLRLTTSHRQNEGPFLTALDEIRRGEVSAETTALFRGREKPPPADDIARIYPTNASTDRHNTVKLNELIRETGVEPVTCKTKYEMGIGTRYDPYPDEMERARNTGPFANEEQFAVGARVVITKNNWKVGVVNGDVGELTGYVYAGDKVKTAFGESLMSEWHGLHAPHYGDVWGFRILLDRTGKECIIGQMKHELASMDALIGFPLRLAWAMTIHKMQGMTLDEAYFDMDEIARFPDPHGLAYVGLSRTRTLEGLMLRTWHPEFVRCHMDAEILL